MELDRREYLKKNIYNFSLMDIVRRETLDYSFVIKYILNENYQLSEEDKSISVEDVVRYQKHLNKHILENLINNEYMSDDSVDKFDTYN